MAADELFYKFNVFFLNSDVRTDCGRPLPCGRSTLAAGLRLSWPVSFGETFSTSGGGSLSLKQLDYTFVRLGEKFRTSIRHSIPPCTRKVCFCTQLKYTEP